ncbi:hypothetical protein OIV83_005023 [Microbotryomycetes sp. JL201]|nr:hypothetical protein OIV83_005023 [Microbotryomycetes sp. JL201]
MFQAVRPAPVISLRGKQNERPISMDSVQLCIALGDKLAQEQMHETVGEAISFEPQPPTVPRNSPMQPPLVSSVFPPRPATRYWDPTVVRPSRRVQSRNDMVLPNSPARRRARSRSSGELPLQFQTGLKENASGPPKVKRLAVTTDDPFLTVPLMSPASSQMSDDIVALDDTDGYAFNDLFFSPPAHTLFGNRANRLGAESSSSSSGRTSVDLPRAFASPESSGDAVSAILGDDTFGPKEFDADATLPRPSSRSSTAYETAVSVNSCEHQQADSSLAPSYPRSELHWSSGRGSTMSPHGNVNNRSDTSMSFLEIGDKRESVPKSVTRQKAKETGSKPVSEQDSFLDMSDDEQAVDRLSMSKRPIKRPDNLDRAALATPDVARYAKSPLGESFVSSSISGFAAMDEFPAPPVTGDTACPGELTGELWNACSVL